MGLTNGDLATWTEEKLVESSNDICQILSIKNYLKEFVHGYINGFWINA